MKSNGTKTQEFKIGSVTELGELAQSWIRSVTRNHVLLLEGEMGAGKTEFCKQVLSAMGIGDVTSPTFSLIHTYDSEFRTIHHLDLFRLKNEEDLETTGFWDLLSSSEPSLFLIEWGDRLNLKTLALPGFTLQRLKFKVLSPSERELILITE